MQSAGTKMAFHLHFSSFYHIHTYPRWQRLASSNMQDFKRDKHLCSFNLPILVWRNGPDSVSVLGLFWLELPAIFFVSVFFLFSQSSQNISHPFMICRIKTMLLINGKWLLASSFHPTWAYDFFSFSNKKCLWPSNHFISRSWKPKVGVFERSRDTGKQRRRQQRCPWVVNASWSWHRQPRRTSLITDCCRVNLCTSSSWWTTRGI